MTAEPLHRIPLHLRGVLALAYSKVDTTRFAVRPTGMVFFPLCASPIVRVLFLGLPSLYVSYVSTFLAQAMSLEGRVAATMAGAKDLVNGENAMVGADNDTDAFAATIERLLADAALATRLGEAGRRFAHETLTWSSAAARIENVYRGLV